MDAIEKFAQRVSQIIEGDLHIDRLHRGIYATDASIYQIVPKAVVYPSSAEDVVKVVKNATELGIPILPRGGGTSLAGQTVGAAIVLDFTRYMHRVIGFNPSEQWIEVEPGITRDEVNAITAVDNLEFAPDPATSSRATIGGMVANNSSGTKSILYGKTSDHVLSMQVLLADGRVLNLKPGPLEQQIAENPACKHELKSLHQLPTTNHQLITDSFPKTMRRVNGYALDALLEDDPWNPHQVFIGSEGTLGVILSVRISLVQLPRHKGLAVVQFDNTLDAVRAVETMLKYNPAAVEILSDDVLRYSRKNLVTRDKCGFIQGNPESIQVVEFYGDDASELSSRAESMQAELSAQGLGYAFDYYAEGPTYNDVWDIRKKGLGLLLGEPSDERAIAFIEDAAIPVEVLPEYIEKVMQVCERHHVHATFYAHASVGVIHVRPSLDLRKEEDIGKMESIAREVFRTGKVLWRRMERRARRWTGPEPVPARLFRGGGVFELLKEVKSIFDPTGIMNPGKIIDAPPMTENLRYGQRLPR